MPSMLSLKRALTLPLFPKEDSILALIFMSQRITSLPMKTLMLVYLSNMPLMMMLQLSVTRSTSPYLVFSLQSLSWLFSFRISWTAPWKASRQAFSSQSISGLQPMILKLRFMQKSFSKETTAKIELSSFQSYFAYWRAFSSISGMERYDSLMSNLADLLWNSLSSPSAVWCPDMMLNFDLFLMGLLNRRTTCRSMTNFRHLLRQPQLQAIPLSTCSLSRCCISMATRSPCLATWIGLRNIYIDFILHFCCSSQISISSPGLAFPSITVPVMTVPFPLILKQWSIMYRNFWSLELVSKFLDGIFTKLRRFSLRLQAYFYGSALVEYLMMVTFSPSLVLAKTFLKAAILLSTILWSSIMSTLLRTTMTFFMNSSAIIMHSAVWGWMPLLMSIIRNIRSMICAPPIMVLMREA